MINIIGGSGFLGSILSRILICNKLNIKIIDINISNNFKNLTSYGDVRNVETLINTVDFNSTIINLAAEHKDNVQPKSLYYDVNVNGAINVCNVARKKNINKIIFTSTVAVYGFVEHCVDEFGSINPFNDYGKSKWEAEEVYKSWQMEDPENRTLVIIRPTVIFGEGNRGNVFNLLNQIALGKFFMVGNGLNYKSIAYVENVAKFLEYSLSFNPGIYVYNYVDKPDLTMNQLVDLVNKTLGKSPIIKPRLPYWLGLLIGKVLDFMGFILNKKFPISAIRVKKFCANSIYESSIYQTGFVPPVEIFMAIEKTINYEFMGGNDHGPVFKLKFTHSK